MPCNKCGQLLVRDNKKIFCPTCEGLELLERNTTVELLEQNLIEVEQAVFKIAKSRLSKTKLLEKLAWKREEFSRMFFENYQEFDIIKFLSFNLLIFRLVKEDFTGKLIPSDQEVNDLINAYNNFLHMNHELLLFKNGLAEATKTGTKIRTMPNEKYFSIEKSYEINDILAKSKASGKLKEYKLLFDLIYKSAPQIKVRYTPEKFIHRIFSGVNQFYSSLLRNEFFDEVFGLLLEFKKIDVPPGKLMDLVNSFPLFDGTLTFIPKVHFINQTKKIFQIDNETVSSKVIFSEANFSIFPLFILSGDAVCISHRTSFLIYILLYPLFYTQIFNRERERRGKEFEKVEIKKKFEDIGWKYFPNPTIGKVSHLEIDGIATFDRKMLIIECKSWNPIRPFYEYESIQEYLLRDLKGIVVGIKYTKNKPKTIPSLIEKINFVKNQGEKIGYNIDDYDQINGLIVIRGYPPIKDYKGIKILSIDQIDANYSSLD